MTDGTKSVSDLIRETAGWKPQGVSSVAGSALALLGLLVSRGEMATGTSFCLLSAIGIVRLESCSFAAEKMSAAGTCRLALRTATVLGLFATGGGFVGGERSGLSLLFDLGDTSGSALGCKFLT